MSDTSHHEGVIDLPGAAASLIAEAQATPAGRAGRTLTPGAGAPLKQTLLALTKGQVLNDHESPGDATLHVLSGTVRLTAGSAELTLGPGAYVPIPPTRHGVESLDDAVLLLTVAQGRRA